jgi:transcriptional regulator with XRE-family HTH domain
MARRHHPVFPALARQLEALGARVRAARLRRRIAATLFAERIGISRDTAHRLEKGDPAISLGTYAAALRVLGLDRDLDLIAKDDELGRKLQDLELERGRRRGT